MGGTKCFATASVEGKVPGSCAVRVRAGLPPNMACCAATHTRGDREAHGQAVGADAGDPAADRAQPAGGGESELLGELTITLDCDVLNAMAAPLRQHYRAYVALALAIKHLQAKNVIRRTVGGPGGGGFLRYL